MEPFGTLGYEKRRKRPVPPVASGTPSGAFSVQRHQIPRRRHRQRLEEHRVEQREDRGVGADAESQRRDRGQGESGRPSQRSRAITHVLHQHIEKCARPHRAHVLLDRLDPAELQRRGATRFRLIQTALHLLLYEQRIDGPDLVVEVAVDTVPVHDISPEAGDAGFQRHDSLRCSSQPDTQIGSEFCGLRPRAREQSRWRCGSTARFLLRAVGARRA